jgi:hypothetical protein
MSVVNNNLLLTADAGVAPSAYQISRSLRFNSADSAYLNRTPSVAGNRQLWTFSCWVKRAALSGSNRQVLFSASTTGTLNDTNVFELGFGVNGGGSETENSLHYSTATLNAGSTALFRDFSAWYHIVFNYNGSNLIGYVNNINVLSVSRTGDLAINGTFEHSIGRQTYTGIRYFPGYLADVHFIDGQALTPSSFTETNATTGQLVPKAYTGTYGTNGFRLNFSDNSAATAATLGADSSGNGNNWTPNNLSVNAGGQVSISAASGGLPIYNTTDTYGTVKGTGTRTDSNASSLVLAIPMDGANNGTTFTDESANIRGSGTAKAITRNGDTKTLTAQSKYYGSSGYFDGSGDYLSLASSADFAFGTADFAIECWVYFNALDSNTTVLRMDSGNGFNGILFCHGSNAVYITSSGSSWNIINGSVFTGLTTGTWTHLALTRSGSTFRGFVNGTVVFTVTSSASIYQSSPIARIGCANSDGSFAMNGYIQDLRIYKGVAKYTSNFTPTFGPNNWTPNNLSVNAGGQVSISAASGGLPIYNTTDTYGTVKGSGTRTDSNAASLVLAIPMDGANNGTTFTDQSATIRGSGSAKAITCNGDTKTLTAQSKFYGSSGFFDGTGDYLSIPAGSSFPEFTMGTSDYTIEMWFNPISLANSDTIFSIGNVGSLGGDFLTLEFQATGELHHYVAASSQGVVGPVCKSNQIITSNSWNHVAVQRSGNIFTMHLNGVIQSYSITSAATILVANNVYIGSSNYELSGRSCNAYIQDVRIYKGVAKYTSNFTPPTATQNTTVAAGNDSLTDTPTSYGTDTGAGGEVRGNYATWNPLESGIAVAPTNGNLDCTTSTSGNSGKIGTIRVSTGKWYWEVTPTSNGGNSYIGAAIPNVVGYAYASNGKRYPADTAYGATYTNNDVIGVALNLDAGTLAFYKNGVSQGTALTGLSGSLTPYLDTLAYGSGAVSYTGNFGQRPFAYAAPSGFKALCDTNIAEGTITTSGTFTGNANADGPFVYLNGVPTAMTINSNAVTFATHADKLANGFKVRSSSGSYNTAGSNTFSITTTGAKFKYARAEPNP